MWARRVGGFLYQLVLDSLDDRQRTAFEFLEIDKAEGETTPGFNRKPGRSAELSVTGSLHRGPA
jgi:hypothetical protein